MINFRFHLVSLIAVFLALALGVVVGSTVIDRAIVDGLESQIRRVERNADDQRRANGELRGDIERSNVFAEQVALHATSERLANTPVVVLATRGIDEDAVRTAVGFVRQAGAAVPGVLWLEPRWGLVEDDARRDLRRLLGVESRAAAELRTEALTRLARRLGAGSAEVAGSAPVSPTTTAEAGGPTTTTTQAVARSVDVLEGLVEAGFVEVDRAGGDAFELADYPGVGARTLVATGPDAQVSAASLLLPVARALSGVPLLALAAEFDPSREAGEEATVVAEIRTDDELADVISTVDSADSLTGRVAIVLALEELGRGASGHYGLGPGASRQLPEPAQR